MIWDDMRIWMKNISWDIGDGSPPKKYGSFLLSVLYSHIFGMAIPESDQQML
jgi:hypothetical protein